MVLANLGVTVAEDELRVLCDCTVFGTDALKTVDAARRLGLTRTAKYTLTIKELQTLVSDGHFPIVFVDLRPIDGRRDIHTLVVIGISHEEVIALDPLKGERSFPLQAFNAAWAMRHNLAILVER
jgi:ABC-type bacteriocin/lantibiotic exporter with double-glycine peptidase domain